MDEATWLTSQDPAAMLAWVLKGREPQYGAWRPNIASKRKLRLFSCAVDYVVGVGKPYPHLEVIGEAERYADGLRDTLPAKEWIVCQPHAERAAEYMVEWAVGNPLVGSNTLPIMADILRDIFGNPFRTPDMNRGRCFECGDTRRLQAGQFDCSYCRSPLLTWNNGTIPKLAQSIYDSRDFSGMQVLGDAMEEAGCTDETILNHCRGVERCQRCGGIGSQSWPELDGVTTQSCSRCFGGKLVKRATECVRGCFLLDLILGKS